MQLARGDDGDLRRRSPAGSWTCRRCGGGCTGRPRRASASAGTRCGCWRGAGRRPRWRRRWSATRTRSATGWPASAGTAPRASPSSRRGGSPPPSTRPQQAELKAAVQAPPRGGGHRRGRLELEGGAAFCRRALRRDPGPQRLPELPAPAGLRRQAPEEAPAQGGRGEAGRLRARVRRPAGGGRGAPGRRSSSPTRPTSTPTPTCAGKWVLKGEPALVDSTSPRWGEKASYYSAVCLETGEVEAMALEGNSCAETSVAFLPHLRAPPPRAPDRHLGQRPGPRRRRRSAPTSPRPTCASAWCACRPTARTSTPTRHIWGWVREEVTANTCFGTAAKVREHVDPFFAGSRRADEVKRRCRRADPGRRPRRRRVILRHQPHVDPTVALV